MKKKKKTLVKPIPITNYTCDGHIIEMMRVKPGSYALIHQAADGKIEVSRKTIRLNGVTYCPRIDKLIKARHIQIPPMPSREHQDLTSLFPDVSAFIKKYVTLPPDFLTVATAFVIASWIYQRFQWFPYLQFTGPPGRGKSRALKVITRGAYHGHVQAVTTSAVIYSLITQYSVTMAVDEMDVTLDSLTRAIYREGAERGGSVVRCRGKNWGKLEPYSPFGPKLYAGQQPIEDVALNTRVITQNMLTVKPEQHIPAELPAEFEAESQRLQSRLLRWKLDNYFAVTSAIPDLDSHRQQQVFMPLLTVCPEKYWENVYAIAKKQATRISTNAQDTLEGEVLVAIKAIGPSDCIRPVKCADELGNGITKEKVAIILKRLGIDKCEPPRHRDSKGARYVYNQEHLDTLYKTYGVEDVG